MSKCKTGSILKYQSIQFTTLTDFTGKLHDMSTDAERERKKKKFNIYHHKNFFSLGIERSFL
jgi:hypothetical protein